MGPRNHIARRVAIFTELTAALIIGEAGTAGGRQVDIPLRLDHAFVRQAIVEQVYGSTTEKLTLWDDETGCGFLRLWDPQVSSRGPQLRLTSHGEGRLGTSVGSMCLAPVQWDGFLEILEEPQVSADRNAVQFRVVDSNLYDANWKKPLFTGRLWDLVKARVHERFESVSIDIAPPLRDLRAFLPLIVPSADAERGTQLLESVRVTRVETTASGITAKLAFDVALLPTTGAPTPEPTLTAEELERLDVALQQWDAFLTFVVKILGSDTPLQPVHEALGETLLDARYEIVEALAPTVPSAADPTAALFVRTWERLAPIVRNSAATQPGGTAMRYLSFVAAGDALVALQQIGPEVGLDLSADGLRRLARIVAPQSSEDPLAYSTEVDPELRDLLGFGPPLPPPELPPQDEDVDQSWWRLLQPRRAVATADAPSPKGLEQWLPTREQIEGYLQAVRRVLEDATGQALGKAALPSAHQEVYRHLVLATAWQESCWRQFVRQGGTVTYIRSPVGAVGMMQINERVWRGLYDPQGLRWDIRYNGRAGSEILLHYLNGYALARKEHLQPGGIDNLARSTYAVYNGGPGHVARYRKPTTSRSLRRIDDLFWQKYQSVTAGRVGEVSICIVGE